MITTAGTLVIMQPVFAYEIHPLPVRPLYMESNTVGHLYVRFSTYYHNQTIKLGPMNIYDANLTNHVPLDLADLTVIPNRTSITLDFNSAMVDYTVTARNNLTGIYALPLEQWGDMAPYVIGSDPQKIYQQRQTGFQCTLVPFVVGIDSSQINEDVLSKFITTTYNCPVSLVTKELVSGQSIFPLSVSSGVQIENETSSTSQSCLDGMTQNMKTKYASFDEGRAKAEAVNYDAFKSEVKDDKYIFRTVSQEWKNNQAACNATLKTVLVLFTVTDALGKDRDVTVMIDPESYKPSGIDVKYDVPIHGGIMQEKIPSPLQQFRHGTKVEDVICPSNFVLIINHQNARVACVRPLTLDRLASGGWAEVKMDPKLLHMDVQVSGSYIPLTLQDHFLRGSLKSKTGPLSNATVSIFANGVSMGTTTTFPDGCFQFNNWNEKKFSPKIDEYIKQDRLQVEHVPKYILFSARYAGDKDHYPTSAQASSFLYLYLPPIAPSMYVINPQSLVENITQGSTIQFQLGVKSILKQSEIENPNLVLQPTPCGLDYTVKPIGNGTITQTNEGKFLITLKALDYVTPGKYFVKISNNPLPPSVSEYDDLSGFVLYVVEK